MATNKTTETTKSVNAFIKTIKDEGKQKDSLQVIGLITKESGFEAKMWGPSIVGFGTYHYQYESGREGDSPLVAFSPRSSGIVFYLSGSFDKRDELLESLGKHKTDKGCVTIKKLEDINTKILMKMIVNTIKHRKALYLDKTKK